MDRCRVRTVPALACLALALALGLPGNVAAKPAKHPRRPAAPAPYGPLDRMIESTMEHVCLLDWDAAHMALAAVKEAGWTNLERNDPEILPANYWGAEGKRPIEGRAATLRLMEQPMDTPGVAVTYTNCGVDFPGDGFEAMTYGVMRRLGNVQRERTYKDGRERAWAFTERNDVQHGIDPDGLDSPDQAAEAARALEPGMRLVTVHLDESRRSYTSLTVRIYRAGPRPKPDPNLFQDWPRLLAQPKGR